MEAPKCPLCKTNHFAREGCDFKRDVIRDSEDDRKGDAADPISGANGGGVCGGQEKVDRTSVGSVRQPFDRKRYQREYMRRRRAK